MFIENSLNTVYCDAFIQSDHLSGMSGNVREFADFDFLFSGLMSWSQDFLSFYFQSLGLSLVLEAQ